MPGYDVFDLSDVVLEHGATLRDAELAYKTYGELNPRRDNVIVYPTSYGGQHTLNEGGSVRAGRWTGKILHHCSQHVPQPAIVLAEEHAQPLRQGTVPPGHPVRKHQPAQVPPGGIDAGEIKPKQTPANSGYTPSISRNPGLTAGKPGWIDR